MNDIKKGDIVVRKSYGKDIIFRVINILNKPEEKIAVLNGVIERIEADSKIADLELVDKQKVKDILRKMDSKIENRIEKCVKNATSLGELYDAIKTKRYTHSRIRRIILKSYLSITKEYSKDVPYIRILGFNKQGKEILNEMKKNSKLPIISRYSDIDKLDDYGRKLFELECHCTDLYNLGYKTPLPCGTEQKSKIIIVD